jgi:hypothetical protein
MPPLHCITVDHTESHYQPKHFDSRNLSCHNGDIKSSDQTYWGHTTVPYTVLRSRGRHSIVLGYYKFFYS